MSARKSCASGTPFEQNDRRVQLVCNTHFMSEISRERTNGFRREKSMTKTTKNANRGCDPSQCAERQRSRRRSCRGIGRDHRVPDDLGAEPQGHHAQPHRHVLFDADRHRPPGVARPRLQGRDVGHRPSGPDQPHDPGPELDRRRRQRDLADQGLCSGRRHPGRRRQEDRAVGQGDAALQGGRLRRQGGLARGRLALRVHVSRGGRRDDLP